MDKRLLILSAITGFVLALVSFPEGALSVLLILMVSIPAIFLLQKNKEKNFLVNIFLVALLARIWLGIVIEIFDLRGTLGPDAYTYNNLGVRLLEIWSNKVVPNDMRTILATSPDHIGWGMIRSGCHPLYDFRAKYAACPIILRCFRRIDRSDDLFLCRKDV